jgi:hypothetical protein
MAGEGRRAYGASFADEGHFEMRVRLSLTEWGSLLLWTGLSEGGMLN